MSKIVCNVCGTSYPDTADQCPICGYANAAESGVVKNYTHVPGASDSGQTGAGKPYTPVRGGRFSSKNVAKRLKEKQKAPGYVMPVEDADEDEPSGGSNRGLLIAVILLLLAILAVCAYLYVNYFMDPIKPSGDDVNSSGASTNAPADLDQTDPGTASTDVTTTDPEQTDPEADVVACTDIKLDSKEVTLSNAGDGYLINYTLSPANTTEKPVFDSSNPSVATVDSNGKITAVGPGTATITVTCGTVSTECKITCDIVIPDPTTEPTTAPETEPVATNLKLSRSDFTLDATCTAWTVYLSDIPNNQVKWWMEDESIATVTNGTVKAVSEGVTTLYAEYQGVTYKCIVRIQNFD